MEKSFYELWKLGINFIKTKIFFPKARLIRFPFDIRGKKFIKFGKNFTTGTGCRIEAYNFQDSHNAKSIKIIARACFFIVIDSPLKKLIMMFIYWLILYSSCLLYRLNTTQVKKSSLRLK